MASSSSDTSPTSTQPPSQSSSTTSLSSQRFPFLSETSSTPILSWQLHTFQTHRTTPANLCRELDAAAMGQPYPNPSSSKTSHNTNSSSTNSQTSSRSSSGRTNFSSSSTSRSNTSHRQRLRCSRIPIPRFTSRVQILQRDLYEEPERSKYAHFPNQMNCIASIGLPRGVFWRRALLGQYRDLYVISPEGSPGGGSSPVDVRSREGL